MRYLITFSYDGTNFYGFQRQNKKKTIQEEIEKALTSINDSKVEIVSSGRTDKGVHALGQTAHFDFNRDITLYHLKSAINSKLNKEIHVIDIKRVCKDFHARYNVTSKTYNYIINMGEFNPIEKNYVYQYNKQLDIELMKKGLDVLLGEHDFRSFCKDSDSRKNCVRIIKKVFIEQVNNKLIISIEGNGFLRCMVRNIVGLLIDLSNNKVTLTDIATILQKKEKDLIKNVAPSCGLYLMKVNYIKDIDK